MTINPASAGLVFQKTPKKIAAGRLVPAAIDREAGQ
jgi:hypothetical protein